MNRLKDIPLLAQPGERWSYSYAVDVQGAALEKMSGKKFGEYLKQNVFRPLGMNDTALLAHLDADQGPHGRRSQRNATSGEQEVFPDGYGVTVRTTTSRAAAVSPPRCTTMRASCRCSSTRASSTASASSSRKP